MKSAVCPPSLDTPNPFPDLLYPQSNSSPPPAATIPSSTNLTQDDQKRIAGHRAVDHVASGMVVGLGTGSTAVHALDRIADLLRNGGLTDIVGIPTSLKSEAHAKKVGIPLADLVAHTAIDISIDGADEVDPMLNLVKGRGGSLLREKMIEGASRKFVVIVDESKLVPRLGGSGGAVPVEIVPFGWGHTLEQIKKLFEKEAGFSANLRMAKVAEEEEEEKPFLTDNNNYIVEMFFEEGITGDLYELSDRILRITGVVEHGMFLGMATLVIVAKKDGDVMVLTK